MRAPELPPSIRALAHDIHDRGGRAYVVGGGIRDHLLGVAVKDWDVEVFGIAGPDLVKILRRHGSVNTVGRSFGVYKWRPRGEPESGEIDVSIPRRDSKVGPGHRGIAVEGDPDMTVEEAALRRDLTINAMMWDVVGETLVDPWNGAVDLAERRLRAVDADTFLEDPLRALRAVQFAARLGFAVDEGLLELCRRAALEELPAERIQGEWGKLLLKAERPSVGLQLARATQVLERVFPEVADLDTDAVLDTLAARARSDLPSDGARWTLMLAGWLHTAGPGPTEATLDRLWMHTVQGYPVRAQVLAIGSARPLPLQTDADLRKASVHAPLRLLLPLEHAISGDVDPSAWDRAEALGILDEKPRPLLQGRHLQELGVAPGPEMGEILRNVYQKQLEGSVSTLDEALRVARDHTG